MFRTMFARYMEEQQDTRTSIIGRTDDFVCQECTRWSGLGAIDILAGVLNVSTTTEGTYGIGTSGTRHSTKILSVETQALEALNVINDRPYRIKIDMKCNPFRRGQIVFGSLVPWRGEWYWSGEQQAWDNATRLDMDDLKRDMNRRSSRILCRYWKEYENAK